MNSQKQRQLRLQKLRSLLKEDKSTPERAPSDVLEQTDYSFLHGQSQEKQMASNAAIKENSNRQPKKIHSRLTLKKKAKSSEKLAKNDSELSKILEDSTHDNSDKIAEESELSTKDLNEMINAKNLENASEQVSCSGEDDTELHNEDEQLSDDGSDADENDETASFMTVEETTIPGTDFEVRVSSEPLESNPLFSSLKKYGVSPLTLKRMKDLEFVNMTDFQAKTIPALLEGRDVLCQLTPNCGKVLAYLIPALEVLLEVDFKRQHGTGIIILVPTPELIRDVYDLIKLILKPHSFSCCNLMSSNAREHDTESLRQGATFVVCTPGHLLYHMRHAPVFKYSNVQYVVIDEIDRIAELGLHFELSQVLNALPKRRQTVVFARNINEKTLEIANYCLKKKPFYVGAPDDATTLVGESSPMQCVLCPTEKRLSFLYSFLRSKQEKKIVVLFSSCLSAQYHCDILDHLNMDNCLCIHGKQNHPLRKETCAKFVGLTSGILLCTNAAAIDLELPQCDCVVQYEPPDDTSSFFKYQGRVVGSVGLSAEATLLLRPEEQGFFSHLRKANVPFKELKLPLTNLMKIGNEVEPAVKSLYALHKSSRDGYMAFVKAYAAHHMSTVFDVKTLDLVNVARSFGFAVPPFVDFDVHCRQVGKPVKRKFSDNEKKVLYAEKKTKKSKRSKHLRFKTPKTV